GIMSPLLTDYAPSLNALPARQEEQIFLKPGASGPAVKELQQALKRQGFFAYVDGNYGTSTQKAVMEFQRKNGLNPDGRVNTATRDKLMAAQTDAIAPWWSKRSGSGSTG